MLPAWPLLRREPTAATVRAALRERRGVAVYGDAGVGKTVLARAAADDAAIDLDLPVLHLSGTTAGGPTSSSALEDLLGRSGLPPRPAGPVAIVQVDDAHLLGEVGAAHLADRCRAGEIVLLLTLRRSPARPVPPALSALWRDDVVERVDLGPLTREEVAALLGEALGGDVVVHASWDIFEATQGNPFHVREAVRRAVASGALRRQGDVWNWLGPVEVGDRIREVLVHDLDVLEPGERTAVELVAMAEPVSERELVDAVGLAALDGAVASGLVTHDRLPPGAGLAVTLSSSHPLYGTAVRELVTPTRRRQLWDLLHPAAVAPRVARGAEVRRTVWAIEVGAEPPAAEVVAAARHAAERGDVESALRLCAAVLARLDLDVVDRVDALLVAANVHRFVDAPDAALAELVRIDELLADPDLDRRSPELLVRTVAATRLRADVDQYHHDAVDAALDRLDALARSLADDPAPAAAALAADLGRERLARMGWAGRFAAGLPGLRATVADESVPLPDRLPLVAPAVFGLAQVGRLDDARHLVDRFAPATIRFADLAPWSYQELGSAQVMMLLWSGELDAAGAVIDATFDVDDPRFRFERAIQHAGLGRVAAVDGRWTAAAELFRSAAATFELRDHSGYLAWCRAWLAYALAASNRRDEAIEVLAAARRTPLRTSRVNLVDHRMAVLQAAATLAEPDAEAQAVALADEFAGEGLVLGELLAAHMALHLTDATAPAFVSRQDRVLRVASQVDGALAAAIADLAGATAGPGNTGRTDLVGDERRRRAEAAVRAAGGWLPTPSALAALSGRQAEVARLAAQGLSSKVIAERLFVSPRTVETHIANIFTKLGIHSRPELADLLGPA